VKLPKKNYEDKLKQRYGDLPEIKRIARHRHLPRLIKNIKKQEHEMTVSKKTEREKRETS